MNFLTVDGVIGAVFVLVYAYERFNTPKTNRSMTTWWRFWTFSIIYYISVVFIYVLLAKSTILLQVLASTRVNALADFGAGVDVKQIIDSLSPELVAALFLTILLRRLDFLAKPDDWLRTLFQTMAAIPHAARHIGAEIRRATFSETEDVVNRLRPLTRRMDFDLDTFRRTEKTQLRDLWMKTLVVINEFEGWPNETGYSKFYGHNRDEIAAIKSEIDRIGNRIRRLMNYEQKLEAEESDFETAVDNPINDIRESITEECEALFDKMSILLARGLLHSEIQMSKCRNRLFNIGFKDMKEGTWTSNVNEVVAVALIVFVIAATSILLSQGSQDVSVQRLIRLPVMLMILFTSATLISIMTAENLVSKGRGPESEGVPPFGTYVLAALFAAAAWMVISGLFKLIRVDGPGYLDALLTHYETKWHWGLGPVLFAFLLTMLLDGRLGGAISRFAQRRGDRSKMGAMEKTVAVLGQRRRVVEALFLCLAMIAVGIVVVYLRGVVDPGAKSAPYLRICTMYGTLGLCIGFLVPRWYRKKQNTKLTPLEILSKTDIFKTFPHPELANILTHARIEHYAADETVIKQGDAGNVVYGIISGTVEVRITDSEGMMSPVATLSENEIFGEMSALTGQSRIASVVAFTACEVFMLDRWPIVNAIKDRPDLQMELARVMAARRLNTEARHMVVLKGTPEELIDGYAKEFLKHIRATVDAALNAYPKEVQAAVQMR